jgi:predicted nucleic acid-binding protein
MRLLFDTNIILDITLNREPHYKDSANIFKKIDNKSIFGFITATTITDIYYIAKKEKGHIEAINFITNLIQIVDIVGIDREIIINSLTPQFLDFEDAIQSIASSFNNIYFIITRNIKDFINSEIKAISLTDFLLQYKIKK